MNTIKVTNFSIDDEGVVTWINQSITDDIHKGRMRFLENCIRSSSYSNVNESLISMFRGQLADTRKQCQERANN